MTYLVIVLDKNAKLFLVCGGLIVAYFGVTTLLRWVQFSP